MFWNENERKVKLIFRMMTPHHTHYIWFPSSEHYLTLKERLSAWSLLMWRERVTAQSQAATTWRQRPCYRQHGLSTDMPLSDVLEEKGSTHSGFQKGKVNLICSAVELTKWFRRCQFHYRESEVPSLLQWGNCVQTWQGPVLLTAGTGEL